MTLAHDTNSDRWSAFRLVPDDVLFFRDGKPSTQGSDHYLRSIFPPHPFTLYGALRTRRLLDEGVKLRGLDRARWSALPRELRDELGEWSGFGSLEVRGPWLVRKVEKERQVLLPAPADLAIKVETVEKPVRSERRRPAEPAPPEAKCVARLRPLSQEQEGGASHTLALLEPCRRNGAGWEPLALEEQRSYQSPGPRTADWWLTPEGLALWRAGGVPLPAHLVHRDRLWVDEQRTGVGLEDETRKAKDSMIYTFGFVRLQRDVALGFEVRGTRLAADRRVRLGGDGRTAVLEDGPALPAPGPGEKPAPGEPARVVFATPTLSDDGAWPPGLDVRGAALGGFTLIGGWDLAQPGPKPLRRAIPAGSVFLLDPGQGVDLAALDGRSIAGYPEEELARQGFGLALVGREDVP